MLRPKAGDCCVFCSYGSVKCPPIQLAGSLVGLRDGAGVAGAVLAALCCMGMPVIVGVLGALGLSSLRQDAILWPLMFLSLAFTLWGLVRDRRQHGRPGALAIAVAGGVTLVAGVVFVHGPLARDLIYAGALALVAATLWNILARRSLMMAA